MILQGTIHQNMMGKAHEDAPIMKDLYQLILEKTKKAAEYKELATFLKDIAIGGDSFLFKIPVII